MLFNHQLVSLQKTNISHQMRKGKLSSKGPAGERYVSSLEGTHFKEKFHKWLMFDPPNKIGSYLNHP